MKNQIKYGLTGGLVAIVLVMLLGFERPSKQQANEDTDVGYLYGKSNTTNMIVYNFYSSEGQSREFDKKEFKKESDLPRVLSELKKEGWKISNFTVSTVNTSQSLTATTFGNPRIDDYHLILER
ncbi:MAG: hypothetical protein H6581_31125 [Bacteroidia bacterium]|nr:hypothetical protein [Bacteroidia bacterium]